jgi:hypothetical protein
MFLFRIFVAYPLKQVSCLRIFIKLEFTPPFSGLREYLGSQYPGLRFAAPWAINTASLRDWGSNCLLRLPYDLLFPF